FPLAGLYAFSEYRHRDWITLPAMANSHGLLNGMGFVLLGLLGWVLELQGRIEKQEPAVALQQKRCKRRDLRPCSHARARSLRVYKNCAQRQRPTSLPEISTIAEVASRSARSWLPLMTLSLEFNFHRIADVQDKIAGIFHSPFHVRN